MMFVLSASTISYQPSFRNKGFSAEISPLDPESELQHPDYSALIPPMYRRRMTDVLKMSIACTIDALQQADLEQPDSIIVGTSMGCSLFSQRFLDKIYASEGRRISPTAFILSTHNSIAGQISLLLGNHGYNMTHTQNNLSFEQALMDAMLMGEEGNRHVLVGGADERNLDLYNLRTRLGLDTVHETGGASFFVLGEKASQTAPRIKLLEVESFAFVQDTSQQVQSFLHNRDQKPEEIDLVLFGSCFPEQQQLSSIFEPRQLVDYQNFCGSYLSNSSFAMAYAVDILQQGSFPFLDRPVKRILICNQLIPENLGLILLERQSDDHETTE